MTKTEFLQYLKRQNINENLFVLDNSTRDGYCLKKNYNRWEACYRENGIEFESVGFPSESDAFLYLLKKAERISENQQKLNKTGDS